MVQQEQRIMSCSAKALAVAQLGPTTTRVPKIAGHNTNKGASAKDDPCDPPAAAPCLSFATL